LTTTTKWVLGIGATVVLVGLTGILLVFVLIGSSLSPEDESYEVLSGDGEGQVAVVEINDIIIDSKEPIRELRRFKKRSSVKAIVVHINSPGGGVVASHEIYEQVKEIASEDDIPVVVSMGSVAASGGYYIACGATRIMANPGTITGSIGVISQFTNFQELLQKIGIESKTIKSGKFKDIGSPTRPMTEIEVETIQSTIDDIYGQFVDIVVENRHLGEDSVRSIADGRIYSGTQALELGLIDTLGTFQDAIMLAANLGGIDGEPRILKIKRHKPLIDHLMGTETSHSIEDIRARFNQLSPLEYRMSF
jgi:protease IV